MGWSWRESADGAKTRGQTGLSTRRRAAWGFREEAWRLGTVSSVHGFSQTGGSAGTGRKPADRRDCPRGDGRRGVFAKRRGALGQSRQSTGFRRQAGVRGRGENPRTDGTVHAATGGVGFSRRGVAPWDSLVSPRVFADRRECGDGAKTRGQTGLSTRRRAAWGFREEAWRLGTVSSVHGFSQTGGSAGTGRKPADRRDCPRGDGAACRFREELWRLGTVSSVHGFSQICAAT